MSASQTRPNPFVLMLDPEAVIRAVENSRSLRGLRQRICHPLDRPLIPVTHAHAERLPAAVWPRQQRKARH
jgi:hypothetical protein